MIAENILVDKPGLAHVRHVDDAMLLLYVLDSSHQQILPATDYSAATAVAV
jgi:hypothetical protein